MTTFDLRDRVSVAGLGMTEFTSNSGISDLHLALKACLQACDDAGVDPRSVDGFTTYSRVWRRRQSGGGRWLSGKSGAP